MRLLEKDPITKEILAARRNYIVIVSLPIPKRGPLPNEKTFLAKHEKKKWPTWKCNYKNKV